MIKIFLEHSKNITTNSNLLNNNFNKLMSFGFTLNEAATLVSNLPTILFNHLDSVGTVIKLFEDMGLEKCKVKEKLLSYTSLVVFKKDNYNKLRKDLKAKGLTDKQIDKITIKASEIITYIKNVIEYFYEIFYKFGFENTEINEIIIENPKILYHKLDKISNVLNTLASYDIKKEELKKNNYRLSYDF